MSLEPARGPACERCGCSAVEHEHLVDQTWHRVPARCLTCSCEGFVAGPVRIELTQGQVAMVDQRDAHLAERKWFAMRHGRTFYAVRSITSTVNGKRRTIREWLHREVLGLPPRARVDHVNGNGLDCRRSNLREASAIQNARNARARKSNPSGFKGVYWAGWAGKWRARIGHDGRQRSLGLFTSVEEAAKAYDAAARAHFGAFACVNFPVGAERPARTVDIDLGQTVAGFVYDRDANDHW